MNAERWIPEFARNTLNPGRAGRALSGLAAIWPGNLAPLEEVVALLPEQANALGHLLSISPVCAEKLVADPEALVWLAAPEVCLEKRGLQRMRGALEKLEGEGFDSRFRALRRWKQREMLRIALREVAGWSTVEQTTLELSNLAEITLQKVVEGWSRELARKHGRPATEFAVLGMGKLGGRELNYSSDIDVVFFYREEGEITPHFSFREFHTRLAEEILATFGANDPAGTLFRMDLRLRPEGASGPLVRSIESMETYYAGYGETWERMALIKARVVAGSHELGYEFAQRMQPFIYPRSVSGDVFEEIAAIKGRIEREIVGEAALHRNVKLGYGGIREIEFIVQTLQILHGARHAFLQEPNTLRALEALRRLQIIPFERIQMLMDAYRFLRTVEHRLQIEMEAQTHLLPEKSEALGGLAKSLGFAGTPDFQSALHGHTEAVREIFNQLLRSSRELVQATPDPGFFRDPERALKALADLDGGSASARFSPRTRRLALQLEARLLEWLRDAADPDAALTRFVRFVERYGARGLLMELLLRHPRLLELLVKLFDASRFMSEIALSQPQLIEEVTRTMGERLTRADYLAGLAEGGMERLHAYRQAQLLRIGLRDLLSFANDTEVQREFVALADACLIFIQQQLGYADTLTLVAMGKFGGGELGYGADLDVLFIGENAKGAAEIIQAMNQAGASGRCLDARLRPEGEAGPLACTLAAYEAYFQQRGQLWEAQALTRARPINGPLQEAFLKSAQAIWKRFGARPDLFAEIAAMLERVARDRAGRDDFLEFKTGTGGLMQLEFFVQAHQMRIGLWEPNTLRALSLLRERGVILRRTAELLSEHYRFLRRCEAVLRRMDNKGVSTLPADGTGQMQLAKRCGFEDRERFLEQYRFSRGEIARVARLNGGEETAAVD